MQVNIIICHFNLPLQLRWAADSNQRWQRKMSAPTYEHERARQDHCKQSLQENNITTPTSASLWMKIYEQLSQLANSDVNELNASKGQ